MHYISTLKMLYLPSFLWLRRNIYQGIPRSYHNVLEYWVARKQSIYCDKLKTHLCCIWILWCFTIANLLILGWEIGSRKYIWNELSSHCDHSQILLTLFLLSEVESEMVKSKDSCINNTYDELSFLHQC